MSKEQEALRARRSELVMRLRAIRSDLGRGLDRDAEEQAIELENMDVLQEISRVAEQELQDIEVRLAELRQQR